MKRLSFLILFITICAAYNNFPQVQIISLDKDDDLLAKPSRVVVSPGDTIQFKAVDGDFDIYIVDAIRIFRIKEADLKVRVDNITNPLSDFYVVREIDEYIEKTYAIYCITTNKWPDAPPKIILSAK
jgi:hypothetical protein